METYAAFVSVLLKTLENKKSPEGTETLDTGDLIPPALLENKKSPEGTETSSQLSQESQYRLENKKSPKGSETERNRKKGKLGLENGRVERTSFKRRGYLR